MAGGEGGAVEPPPLPEVPPPLPVPIDMSWAEMDGNPRAMTRTMLGLRMLGDSGEEHFPIYA